MATITESPFEVAVREREERAARQRLQSLAYGGEVRQARGRLRAEIAAGRKLHEVLAHPPDWMLGASIGSLLGAMPGVNDVGITALFRYWLRDLDSRTKLIELSHPQWKLLLSTTDHSSARLTALSDQAETWQAKHHEALTAAFEAEFAAEALNEAARRWLQRHGAPRGMPCPRLASIDTDGRLRFYCGRTGQRTFSLGQLAGME